MIARNQIFPAGQFGKPHGVNGEINALFDEGVDPSKADCVIVDIDGIYVPFFIESLRPKGRDSYLLTIDGIDSDTAAKVLVNRHIFMRERDRVAITGASDADADADEAEGLFAADLIGYTMTDDDSGETLGRITDIDDSTANVLFIVERPDGSTLMVPVADEFITDIDTDSAVIAVSLPDGLVSDI